MKEVKATDLYEAKRAALLGEDDRKFLLDLYSPIIGMLATSVFLSLYENADSDGVMKTHAAYFKRFQVSSGEFYHALEVLEAIGLVKTFYQKGNPSNYFCYVTYRPKSPDEFFDDNLLSGTLIKYVGKDEAKAIRDKYTAPVILPGCSDVSATFMNVFRPDFNETGYGVNMALSENKRHKRSFKTGFDIAALLGLLNSTGITQSDISQDEIERLERVGALYGLTPELLADSVKRNYDEMKRYGTRINLDKIQKEAADVEAFPYLLDGKTKSTVTSESDKAEQIRYFDRTSPFTVLSSMQEGRALSLNDQRVINHLYVDLALPNGVVNVLCTYVLEHNHNNLDYFACDKLAGALKRSGVKTARDATDYFHSIEKDKETSDKYKKPRTHSYQRKTQSSPKYERPAAEPQKTEDTDEMDRNFEAALALLKGKKK